MVTVRVYITFAPATAGVLTIETDKSACGVIVLVIDAPLLAAFKSVVSEVVLTVLVRLVPVTH